MLAATNPTRLLDITFCSWTHELSAPAGACTCPAGGDHLRLLRDASGLVAGTITVTVLDMAGIPYAGYAREDIQLHVPGMDHCTYGAVNLTDVVLLVGRWVAQEYDPSLDFLFVGVNDLSDIVMFTNHMDHHCR